MKIYLHVLCDFLPVGVVETEALILALRFLQIVIYIFLITEKIKTGYAYLFQNILQLAHTSMINTRLHCKGLFD